MSWRVFVDSAMEAGFVWTVNLSMTIQAVDTSPRVKALS